MPILGTIASSFQSAIASDFQSIATVTLTSTSASISFTSIPNTYRHLQIRGIARSTRNQGDNIRVRLNNDSTSGNYVIQYINAGPGINAEIVSTNQTSLRIINSATGTDADSTIFGAFIFELPEYGNSSKKKSIVSLSSDRNQAGGYVCLNGGYYNVASTVTDITLLPEVGPNFESGTQIALYGIVG